MKQTGRKLLALLLALCMLVGIMPMSAFATQSNAAQFVAQQLSLGDDLTMRFYVTVDAAYVDSAVMTVAVGGSVTGKYELKDMTPDSDGSYVFTADLAAAQMTEDITLELKSGDSVLAQKSYTVQAYAHALLTGSYTDETKQMVKQMLNYGAKAQVYFGYKTDDLANAGYELETAASVPTEVPEMTVTGAVEGIEYYGATLLFESKVAVRYYFTAPDGVDGYTFTVGDESYTAGTKGGRYYVEIPGINPQDMDKAVDITVSDGSGSSLCVSYSPMHYITRMYNKDTSSDALKELLQAIYGYHEAAAAFTGVEKEDVILLSSSTATVKDTNTFVDYEDATEGGNWFNRYNLKIDNAVDADGNVLQDAVALLRVKLVGSNGVYNAMVKLTLNTSGNSYLTGTNVNGPSDYDFHDVALTGKQLKQLGTEEGLNLYAVHNSGEGTVTVYVQDGTDLIPCWTIGGSTTELLCKGYEAQCNVDSFVIGIESVKHESAFLDVVAARYSDVCTITDTVLVSSAEATLSNTNTFVDYQNNYVAGNWFNRYNIKIADAVDENGTVTKDAVALLRVKLLGSAGIYNAMVKLTLSTGGDSILTGTNVNGPSDYEFQNVTLTAQQLKQLGTEQGLNLYAVHNSGDTTVTVYLQDGIGLIPCWTIGGSEAELLCKGYEAQCDIDGFAISIESIKHEDAFLDVMEARYGDACVICDAEVISKSTETVKDTNTFVDLGDATVSGSWFNRYNLKMDNAVDAEGNVLQDAVALLRVKLVGSAGIYNAMVKLTLNTGGNSYLTGTNVNGPSDYEFHDVALTGKQLKQLGTEDGLNLYAVHNSGEGTVAVYLQDGTDLIPCWTIGGSTTELLCKGYEAQCNIDGFTIGVESIKHTSPFLDVVEARYGDACAVTDTVLVSSAETTISNTNTFVDYQYNYVAGNWFNRYNIKIADAVDENGTVIKDAVALMRVKLISSAGTYNAMVKMTLSTGGNSMLTGTNVNGPSDYEFQNVALTAQQLKQLGSEEGLNLYAVHNSGDTAGSIYLQDGSVLLSCWTIGGSEAELLGKGYEAQCDIDGFAISIESIKHEDAFLDVVEARYGDVCIINDAKVISQSVQNVANTNTFVDFDDATVSGSWFNRYNIKLDNAVDADGNVLQDAVALMRVKLISNAGVYNAMLKLTLSTSGDSILTGTNVNGPSDYEFQNVTLTAQQLKQLGTEEGLNLYAVHNSGDTTVTVYLQDGTALVSCWDIGGSTAELLCKGYEAQCNVDGFTITVETVSHKSPFMDIIKVLYDS